jgi:hypothetical protein
VTHISLVRQKADTQDRGKRASSPTVETIAERAKREAGENRSKPGLIAPGPGRKRGPPLRSQQVARRAYRISEFIEMSALSRATVYRRIKDGSIKVTYIGHTPLISAETVRHLLGGE